MAILEFGGFIFEGSLNVTFVQVSDRLPSVLPGPAQQPTWPLLFRYGSPGERLKIDAPQVCFECGLTARGKGDVRDWEAGILQSISFASWAAQYSNGSELRYRLDTDHGLVRDGGSEDSLFFRLRHSFKATALPEVKSLNRDAPGVTFVTEFSGDPFHPHTSPGNRLGQLERTEGKVNFHAFLAVLNQRTGSILTLAESHWILNWDGTYDFASKTWMPNGPDGIITHTESDVARSYENPNDPAVSLPFSVDSAVANERKEVWTPDGWMACREALPDLGDSQRRAAR